MNEKQSFIRRYSILLVSATVLIVGAVWFLLRPSVSDVRHVILISIDTCRADYLSCYGYHRQTTPNIDKFASQCTLFNHVVAPTPLTRPSHSSMFTGTIPLYHGVRGNLDYCLSKSHLTIAEILHKKGFRTGAVVSTFVLDSEFGLDQGFDYYNDDFENVINRIGINERRGDEANRFAIEWLDKHKNEKFFFFLHYFDPHDTYEPPEPFASKFHDNLYAGEIAYVDHCIGEVIEKLREWGLYDSALIIITGDHGEMLGERGEKTHGFFVYDSAIKVPMIMKLPNQSKSQKIDNTAVGLIDIVPTICGMLGIRTPAHVQGADLRKYISSEQTSKDQRYFYCESFGATKYGGNSLLAMTTDRFKYIQTTRPELYDLQADPKEMNNLIGQQPHRARIMQDKLRQVLEQTVRKGKTDSRIKLDEEARRRLASLGYVATSTETDFEFDLSKPDPKDLINLYERNRKLDRLIAKKQYKQAKTFCAELLTEYPNESYLHYKLGRISFDLADMDDAIEHYSNFLSQVKNKPQTEQAQEYAYNSHNKIAIAYIYQDESEKAKIHLDAALRIKPDKAAQLYYIGSELEKLEAPEKAMEQYKQALQSNPDKAIAMYLHQKLAKVLMKQKKFKESLEHLFGMIEIDPDQPVVLEKLGIALSEERRFDEAIKYWKKSLKLKPNQAQVHELMGKIFIIQGKADKAIEHCTKALAIKPDSANAHNNLGYALVCNEKYDQAAEHLAEAVKLDPNSATAQKNMSNAYSSMAAKLTQQDKFDEAIANLKKALAIKPDSATAHYYFTKPLLKKGKVTEAIFHFKEALRIKPDWIVPMNNLAWLLATHKDSEFRDPQQAIRLAERTCQLTSREDPTILDTLAAAYAAANRFPEAVATAESAIELANSAGQKEVAEQIRKRLEFYRRNQPYYD